MLLRALAGIAMGVGLVLSGMPGEALAAPTPKQEADTPSAVAGRATPKPNYIDAKQFRIADGRVPGTGGQPSTVQTITAWQVAKGWWNGQSLDGLSLVLVQTVAEDGRSRPSFACYISHLATPAQRRALVSAYAASLPGLPRSAARPAGGKEGDPVVPVDTAGWRVEPAVIRIDSEGGRVVVHLGTIA